MPAALMLLMAGGTAADGIIGEVRLYGGWVRASSSAAPTLAYGWCALIRWPDIGTWT